MGDAVQPTRDRAALANGACLADQDQEGRLKRVVNILGIAQNASAHAENEWAMPLQERGESRFIALGHNTIRGAAGAAILNAELLLAKGYVDS